jgi:hypothetical protein
MSLEAKMFQKKTPKKEQELKSVITLHLKTTYPNPYWFKGHINVVSIDPGITNLGFRMETRYADGRVTTNYMIRQCFSKSIEEDGYYNSLYLDVYKWFDQFKEYFLNSHVFIVERQMKENYQSLRLSQHIICYLMGVLLHSKIEPLLVEIDSKAKYNYLDVPSGLNEKAKKQWGTELAISILEQRNDQVGLQIINSSRGVRNQKKHDDVSDTIIQIEAFWKLFHIPIL